jgi:class 3 adenylate cyclase
VQLPRVIPALADLTQDIAGPVPVGLLQEWGAGRADPESAHVLLRPFEIAGTVVASDSSGLTRLTREMDLLEVLSLISRPKEIVHAVGTAIGGRGIGRWVADNTQMYYPAALGLELVLGAMCEAQHRIASAARVGVGICLHPGRFYEIGGTLYGHDAQVVESLAEHHAGPGEILATREAVAALGDPAQYALRPRGDLAPQHPAGVFAIDPARRLPDLVAANPRYPHPFTDEFFESLRRLEAIPDPSAVKERLYATYQRERAVVMVARERLPPATDDLTAILDNLVVDACLDAIVRETASGGRMVVSSGGGHALLAFDTPREALAFAGAVRARGAENSIPVRIGIDHGAVLLFEHAAGVRSVAGDPVNVASKMSEDAGQAGRIHLSRRAADRLDPAPGGDPFEITVSGVRLRGVSL